MAVVEAESLHTAPLAVDHREGAAGGIGAGEGWGDHDGQVQGIGYSPGGVRCFASAGPQHGSTVQAPGAGDQTIDFHPAALATEGFENRFDAHRREHLIPDRLELPQGRSTGHDQQASAEAQPLQFPPEFMGGPRALHVAPWRGEHRQRPAVHADHPIGMGHDLPAQPAALP